MNELDESYWTNRYQTNATGWDIGAAGPLGHILEKIEDKNAHILIPGAGNAYEVDSALKLGFENIHVLDFSAVPIENLVKRVPLLPKKQVYQQNFFEHSGAYDIILEQTFFCALNPQLREKYVAQMHHLLNPGGVLTGVMFDFPLESGPAFGGSEEEYRKLFSPKFEIEIMERCSFSIKPRVGRELYVKFRKK